MLTKRGNADQETGSKHQVFTLCDALYQFYEADCDIMSVGIVCVKVGEIPTIFKIFLLS